MTDARQKTQSGAYANAEARFLTPGRTRKARKMRCAERLCPMRRLAPHVKFQTAVPCAACKATHGLPKHTAPWRRRDAHGIDTDSARRMQDDAHNSTKARCRAEFKTTRDTTKADA